MNQSREKSTWLHDCFSVNTAMDKYWNPRNQKGVKGYTELNILATVNRDIGTHLIEAYCIAEQYVEEMLRYMFIELYPKGYDKRNSPSLEVVLKLAVKWGKISDNYYSLFQQFTGTRNELVHKTIFHYQAAKCLSQDKIIKQLPERIIRETRKLFIEKAADTLASCFLCMAEKKAPHNDIFGSKYAVYSLFIHLFFLALPEGLSEKDTRARLKALLSDAFKQFKTNSQNITSNKLKSAGA